MLRRAACGDERGGLGSRPHPQACEESDEVGAGDAEHAHDGEHDEPDCDDEAGGAPARRRELQQHHAGDDHSRCDEDAQDAEFRGVLSGSHAERGEEHGAESEQGADRGDGDEQRGDPDDRPGGEHRVRGRGGLAVDGDEAEQQREREGEESSGEDADRLDRGRLNDGGASHGGSAQSEEAQGREAVVAAAGSEACCGCAEGGERDEEQGDEAEREDAIAVSGGVPEPGGEDHGGEGEERADGGGEDLQPGRPAGTGTCEQPHRSGVQRWSSGCGAVRSFPS